MPRKGGFLGFCQEWRVLDYLACIVCALIALPVSVRIRPFCRLFEVDDPDITHPMAHEDFPNYSVGVALACVFLVCLVLELCYYGCFSGRTKKLYRSVDQVSLRAPWRNLSAGTKPQAAFRKLFHYLNGWVIAQAFSICSTLLIIGALKVYVGALRPDFIARLEQEGFKMDNIANYTADELCGAAREGRVSFPSGHSGTMFAGFIPLVMYLLGLLRVFRGSSGVAVYGSPNAGDGSRPPRDAHRTETQPLASRPVARSELQGYNGLHTHEGDGKNVQRDDVDGNPVLGSAANAHGDHPVTIAPLSSDPRYVDVDMVAGYDEPSCCMENGVTASLWGVIICLIPLVVPCTIAISRTRDYRHNYVDVLAGCLIGIACGLLSVFFVFRLSNITGELVLRRGWEYWV